jgi:hypothetical protein
VRFLAFPDAIGHTLFFQSFDCQTDQVITGG